MNIKWLFFLLILMSNSFVYAQIVKGKISDGNNVIPYVNVQVKGTKLGVSADENGNYFIENVPFGEQALIFSVVGMENKEQKILVGSGQNIMNVNMRSISYHLDQVVITGTKTFKKKTQSPIIVNVLEGKNLESVQACNLAEGLNYQPGLRVETDCQTCNYTQLRMNGLEGGYSQILINGKAIFSPLTGLYGMEQIPTNMIEKVEVVRGGGSALYGSSAIGGIVNVITKSPHKNSYSFVNDYSQINSNASDMALSGNVSFVGDNNATNTTIYVHHRDREWYDHNGDNFSEIPKIINNSFGANFSFTPTLNQKIELNVGSIHEYRFGGEMINQAAHLAMQSEERIHDVLMGNIDYQSQFNEGKSTFLSYLAFQSTKRLHYTGIRPDIETQEDILHLKLPPYGNSFNTTQQGGFQFNHKINRWLGPNLFSLGIDCIADQVNDEIETYHYLLNQEVFNLGTFLQSDWNLTENINLLSGIRMDKHSMLDRMVFNPRFSLLYRKKENTQFRLVYSSGFRAPQAFDTDLHIAFAGGGVSRIELAPDLKEEKSEGFSTSINYDYATAHYIFGYTLEGFYTKLNDAFYLQPIGEDEFGEKFEKRNGQGATVKGITLECRANLLQKLQLEGGVTWQKSLHESPITYTDRIAGTRDYLKTPEKYGYFTFTASPFPFLDCAINLVHTGEMKVLHMAGDPNQEMDEIITSSPFNDIGVKISYLQSVERVGAEFNFHCGVKNLINSYQPNFDVFKNRDSNFIYGPSLPRTFFVGLGIKSL